jgi:hypothetical protein
MPMANGLVEMNTNLEYIFHLRPKASTIGKEAPTPVVKKTRNKVLK